MMIEKSKKDKILPYPPFLDSCQSDKSIVFGAIATALCWSTGLVSDDSFLIGIYLSVSAICYLLDGFSLSPTSRVEYTTEKKFCADARTLIK
jgi:hypothetical protein